MKLIFFAFIVMFISFSSAAENYSGSYYGSGCYGGSGCDEVSQSSEGSSGGSSNRLGGGSILFNRTLFNETFDEIPLNLLDITFELEENIISDSNDLVSVATFENFGSEPFEIDLSYEIFNSSDNMIYNSGKSIQIYIDHVSVNSFDDFYASPGFYSLKLRVNYSNVTENFEQDFEVREVLESPPNNLWVFALAISIFLSFFVVDHIYGIKRFYQRRFLS